MLTRPGHTTPHYLLTQIPAYQAIYKPYFFVICADVAGLLFGCTKLRVLCPANREGPSLLPFTVD